MKKFSGLLLIVFSVIIFTGCQGSGKRNLKTENDTISVPDTGFTGIKQYTKDQLLIKEITFKNGVRQGLMKSFYKGGQLYQTFWYENGVREDSVKWYYLEGQVFRATPYRHDTIDGIQQQYFRNGKLKAKLGYSKGLRTPYLQEYNQNGKLIGGYPDIVVNAKDNYRTGGTYRIGLELSDKSTDVKFYRGEFTDGRFDTAKCKIINTIAGKGTLILKKSGKPVSGTVGVIAEVLTLYGNKYLTYKKIELPYADLN